MESDDIDLEGRHNTASIVLSPRVSDTITLSRPYAADNFSSCAPKAAWQSCRKRMIDGRGKPPAISDQQTRKAVVERANNKTDTELVRLCKIVDYSQNPEDRRILSDSACKKQRWNVRHTLTNRPVLKVDNYFEESVPEAELGRSNKQEGSAGTDVKVPSTSNFEILIWVNAFTDEVQHCRQIAAINTVILTENQNNETSEGPGEPVAPSVTLIAKGDLEQEHLPTQRQTWSIVPCSRDLPGKTQSGCSKGQSGLQGTKERVTVMVHFSW